MAEVIDLAKYREQRKAAVLNNLKIAVSSDFKKFYDVDKEVVRDYEDLDTYLSNVYEFMDNLNLLQPKKRVFTNSIPFLKNQEKHCFFRINVVDVEDISLLGKNPGVILSSGCNQLVGLLDRSITIPPAITLARQIRIGDILEVIVSQPSRETLPRAYILNFNKY